MHSLVHTATNVQCEQKYASIQKEDGSPLYYKMEVSNEEFYLPKNIPKLSILYQQHPEILRSIKRIKNNVTFQHHLNRKFVQSPWRRGSKK